MIVDQAFDDVGRRPFEQLRGHIRGSLEFHRPGAGYLNGSAYPVRPLGSLGQGIRSIASIEKYAEPSVARGKLGHHL